MRKFIIYSVFGTLLTFAILVYLSLTPYLKKLPAFQQGFTPSAVIAEYGAFVYTLIVSWIIWWSVSGLLSLLLYSSGKYTGTILFCLSLAAIIGITLLIT